MTEMIRMTETAMISGRPKYEKEVNNKVFISYSYGDEQKNKDENIKFAEELLRPFLESLGFEVLTFKKNFRVGETDEIITSFINESKVIIGILTKDRQIDDTWEPKPNIPNEIDRAYRNNKIVIPIREKGVELKTFSNILSRLYPTSSIFLERDLDSGRNNYGEILVKLVQGLSEKFDFKKILIDYNFKG
jgi:hypothetical protein